MRRVAEHAFGRTGFDDLTQIHHHDAVAEQAHHVQVMADEKVAHAKPLLEIFEQLQDHHLDRDVQRRGRFIQDQQVGFHRNGAGDADARLRPPES